MMVIDTNDSKTATTQYVLSVIGRNFFSRYKGHVKFTQTQKRPTLFLRRKWGGGKGREDPYSVCHWANTSLPFSSEPSTARHCATCIFPIHTLSVAPIRSLEPSLSRIVSLVVSLSLLYWILWLLWLVWLLWLLSREILWYIFTPLCT